MATAGLIATPTARGCNSPMTGSTVLLSGHSTHIVHSQLWSRAGIDGIVDDRKSQSYLWHCARERLETDVGGVVRLTDPRAMRAMAHPLRLDLIELLGVLGPATAAACGRQLGASQASCSFHLRQLAKYGFVELAPASGDRRERPWRLTDVEQSWSSVDAGPAAAQLDRVFVQREADRMLGWLTTGPTEPEEWRRAAWVGGLTLPVTAAELDSIGESLRAVLEPYVQRLAGQPWPADARLVRILLSATPLTRDLSPDPAPDLPATAPDRSPSHGA